MGTTLARLEVRVRLVRRLCTCAFLLTWGGLLGLAALVLL